MKKEDKVHVVVRGQNLIGICYDHLGQAYGGVYELVARYNRMPDASLIFPGQKLYFPPNVGVLRERVSKGQLAIAGEGKDIEQADMVIDSVLAPADQPVIKLCLPPEGIITSGYGPRGSHFHSGIDAAWIGCGGYPLKAPISGVVAHAGDNGNGYGNHVIIDARPGPVVMLGHFREVACSRGQQVVQGETVVGLIGNTGFSFGDHLHLEYQKDVEDDGWTWGASVDPSSVLQIIRE